jgi:hypothetical protein
MYYYYYFIIVIIIVIVFSSKSSDYTSYLGIRIGMNNPYSL